MKKPAPRPKPSSAPPASPKGGSLPHPKSTTASTSAPKTRSPAKATAKATATPDPTPATSPRRRIVLVDDHPMMRMGMTQLINGEPEFIVCGQAGDAQSALSVIKDALPELVVTDLTLPGRGGLELLHDLQTLHPDIPVLVVSMHDELLHAERALRAGARGYLMKEAGGEKLINAIRHVLSGQVYLSEKMSAKILDGLTRKNTQTSRSPIQGLSDREFQVFHLLGHGRSTREIAKELNLSPKTVDVHRGHIKEKLQLKDATALVRYAVRWVETQQ